MSKLTVRRVSENMPVEKYHLILGCMVNKPNRTVVYLVYFDDVEQDPVTFEYVDCDNQRLFEKTILVQLENLLEVKILKHSREESDPKDLSTPDDPESQGWEFYTVTYKLLMTNRKDN